MKKNARNRKKTEKARVRKKGRKSGFRRISLILRKLLKRTRKLHTKQKSLKRKDKVLLRQNKTLMSRMEDVEGRAAELQLRVTQLQTANRGLLDSLARASDEGVSAPARLDRVESWLGTEEAESERLWKKVDALDHSAEDYAGRLEILEQNLPALADSLEELKLRLGNDPDEDGFVAELRQRIETVEGLYAELNEKSVALASAVAGLPGMPGDWRPDQTDAPTADQAGVEKRLRNLDEDVARLRQGAESLLREFNDLSARFGDVIGRSGIGQDTERPLQSRIEDIDSQDSDLTAQADRQGKHLEDINGSARELEERVSNLSAPGELDDKINNLDKGLHDTAGKLENRIADIVADLDDLERAFNETKSRHQEQLEQLISDVTAEKRGLTEIPVAVEGLSKRIDDLAGGSSKQAEQYLEFKQGIEGLEAARRDFITRLDNHERQIQEKVLRAEGLDRKIEDTSGLNVRMDALEKIQKEMQDGLSGDKEKLDQQIRNLATGHREHLSSYSSFRNTLAIIGLALLVLGAAGYWFGSDWIATRFAENDKEIEEFDRQLIAQDAQLKVWGRQLASGPSPASPEPGIPLEEWNRMKSELELQKKVLSGQVAIHEEYRENLGVIQSDLGKTRVALDAYLERQEEINAVTLKLGEKLKALEKQPSGSGGAPEGRQGTVLKDSSWIRQRNPAHYTIQIAGAYGREVLVDISRRLSLPGPLALYQRDWNGREWNVLLYGDFSSKTEAQGAIDSLPEEIMAAKPWVRRLSWVQKDLEGG